MCCKEQPLHFLFCNKVIQKITRGQCQSIAALKHANPELRSRSVMASLKSSRKISPLSSIHYIILYVNSLKDIHQILFFMCFRDQGIERSRVQGQKHGRTMNRESQRSDDFFLPWTPRPPDHFSNIRKCEIRTGYFRHFPVMIEKTAQCLTMQFLI
jgi:hypothetical protein